MRKDELQTKYPNKSFGSINISRDWEPTTKIPYKYTWSNKEVLVWNYDGEGKDLGWNFYLNHSCDEWIIGNLEEAEKFSIDLQEAIKYAKELEKNG